MAAGSCLYEKKLGELYLFVPCVAGPKTSEGIETRRAHACTAAQALPKTGAVSFRRASILAGETLHNNDFED